MVPILNPGYAQRRPGVASRNGIRICTPKRQSTGALQDAVAPSAAPGNAKRLGSAAVPSAPYTHLSDANNGRVVLPLLRQWQLWKFLEEALARLTPECLAQQLRLMQQWIVIYPGLAYTQLPVVSFTREALQLEGAARDKALLKLEFLERALLTPAPNPRPL